MIRANNVKDYFSSIDPKLLGLNESPLVRKVLPLELGESNLNFLVDTGSRKFVFRVNMDPTQQTKSSREYENLKLLSHTGLAPRAYYLDDSKRFFAQSILIIEFFKGLPLSSKPEKKITSAEASQLGHILATIHSLKLGQVYSRLPERGDTYEAWRRRSLENIEYIVEKTKRDSRFEDLVLILQNGMRLISSLSFPKHEPINLVTPCHGDVCAQNVILTESGRLRFIDWESFGKWDPGSEIARVFEGFGIDFPTGEQEELLTTYSTIRKDDNLFQRIESFRPLVRFENLTWAVKHVLEIVRKEMDVDFVKRTDLRKHLDYVRACMKQCAETNIIQVRQRDIDSLEIFQL